MLASTRTTPATLIAVLRALLAALICSLLVLPCASAAGAPATVTVRVLGGAPNYQALTPLTQVTTTTAPVVKGSEGSCSGTSAAGALELATKGDWEGTWSSKYLDYAVTSIDGQSFPFEENSPANYYWSFWLNNAEATKGVCEEELEAGDQVLFVPACYGASCPPEATHLLSIEAPATAEVGKPVTVTVRSNAISGGASSPAVGAVVTGADTSTLTDAEGHATLTFPGDETYTLRAAGPTEEDPKAIPGEIAVCAHEGDDGACGTPNPNTGATQQTAGNLPTQPSVPAKGPDALLAAVTGIHEGQVYRPAKAPRVLTGAVLSSSPVTSISLRLRRTYRGRCWSYSGSRARLVRVRCGRGSFFKIASGGDRFSYLLPSRLPRGRYVLEVRATDSAGTHSALDRGSSRIVFYVK